MKLLHLLRCPLVLCLLLFQLALGADREKVHVGPAPEWTVALDYDPEGVPAEDQETLGVFHLLLDSQHHVELRQYYRRTVRRVLNETGVQEEGTVQITFNPAFQELTLHAIRIVRSGVKLNRLELDELRIIQRENELERNIFDGTVSVLLILEDLRVGDLVETAYTLTGANPVFGEKFSMSSYSALHAAARVGDRGMAGGGGHQRDGICGAVAADALRLQSCHRATADRRAGVLGRCHHFPPTGQP